MRSRDAGASMMSVHVEVLPHLHRTVHAIKALGVKAGVVLNPVDAGRRARARSPGDVDYVLVMSVNPGFGGQTFIPRSESKVREVRALLDRAGNRAAVEIDGGIDSRNVARVVAAGARIIVAGSADLPRARSRARHARAQGRGARRASRRLRPGDASLDPLALRVRYAETDKMGVVYYANYFVWFEVGAHRSAARLRLELPRDGSRRLCACR